MCPFDDVPVSFSDVIELEGWGKEKADIIQRLIIVWRVAWVGNGTTFTPHSWHWSVSHVPRLSTGWVWHHSSSWRSNGSTCDTRAKSNNAWTSACMQGGWIDSGRWENIESRLAYVIVLKVLGEWETVLSNSFLRCEIFLIVETSSEDVGFECEKRVNGREFFWKKFFSNDILPRFWKYAIFLFFSTFDFDSLIRIMRLVRETVLQPLWLRFFIIRGCWKEDVTVSNRNSFNIFFGLNLIPRLLNFRHIPRIYDNFHRNKYKYND